jgi:predicted nucleic acid-binding protein
VITIATLARSLPISIANDSHHKWAVELMKHVRDSNLVCEPVLTEVVYFLREDGLKLDPLFLLLEREAIRLALDIPAHWPRVRTHMSRYRQMDLADASVVVMTELHPQSQVLTIDRRDFSVYRRNDRQMIDFVSPGRAR